MQSGEDSAFVEAREAPEYRIVAPKRYGNRLAARSFRSVSAVMGIVTVLVLCVTFAVWVVWEILVERGVLPHFLGVSIGSVLVALAMFASAQILVALFVSVGTYLSEVRIARRFFPAGAEIVARSDRKRWWCGFPIPNMRFGTRRSIG